MYAYGLCNIFVSDGRGDDNMWSLSFFYCPANVVYNNNINDNHIKTPHIEYLNGLDTLLRPFFFYYYSFSTHCYYQ